MADRGRGRGRGGGGGDYRGGGGGGFRGGRGGGDRGGGGGRGRGREIIVYSSQGSTPPPYDDKAKAVESAYTQKIQSGMPDLSKLSVSERYPARPAYGVKGNPIQVWANYFALNPPKNLVLQRYGIAVADQQIAQQRRKKRQLIALALQQIPGYAQRQHQIATDYADKLITVGKIPELNGFKCQVKYMEEDENQPKEKAKTYDITFEEIATYDVDDVLNFLGTTDFRTYPNKLDFIDAMNIWLRNFAKASDTVLTVGAKSFPKDARPFGLGQGLAALKGFFSSVRFASSRILVNVNVASGAFYSAELVSNVMPAYGGGNLKRLQRFLKGIRVELTHIPPKKKQGKNFPRIKTIAALATPGDGRHEAHPPQFPTNKHGAGSKDVLFWLTADAPKPGASSGGGKGGKGKGGAADKGEGKYISVFDFFRTQHGITVADTRLPVVNVGSAQFPSYIPAECMKIVPGQPAKSKLTGDQTAQMIKFAAKPPYENAQSIVESSSKSLGIGTHPNPWMKGFNITIPAELITVPARILPAPSVLYAQNKTGNVREGGWNMAGLKVCQGGALRNWVPIFLSVGSDQPAIQPNETGTRINEITNSLQKLGINVERPQAPQLVRIPPVNHPQFDAYLQDVFEKNIKTAKYILFVLPVKSTPVYQTIKHLADVKYGIQCTCITRQHLQKTGPPLEQYVANVGLKINVKCGGRNQGMSAGQMGIVGSGRTMTLGIDVTHPSPGSADTAPSVAAMVANIDKFLGVFPAALRVQSKRRDEMVADLEEMLESRLKLWISLGKNREYPDNILVFRDGVSEGQYHLVLQNELPLLKKVCERLYPAQAQKQGLPRFFVAICGKRHQTRFYPQSSPNADMGSNNKPGTIIDRGVTDPRSWEFFLQAHKCLQGTARPAHFFIIHDEVFSNKAVIASLQKPGYSVADVVEEMCHNMAYLYPRATKAVSLCLPAKLADLACQRARSYLKKYYEPDMSDTESTVSGASQGVLNEQRNLINVHDNVKDTMFYI